jgi:hypothetical protein
MHNRFPRRENCLVHAREIDSSEHIATLLSNFCKQILANRFLQTNQIFANKSNSCKQIFANKFMQTLTFVKGIRERRSLIASRGCFEVESESERDK